MSKETSWLTNRSGGDGGPSEGDDMGWDWGTGNPQDFRGVCSEVDFYALREKDEEGHFWDIGVTQKRQNPRSKEGRRQGLRSQLMSLDPVGSEVGTRAVPPERSVSELEGMLGGPSGTKQRPRGGSKTQCSHPPAL